MVCFVELDAAHREHVAWSGSRAAAAKARFKAGHELASFKGLCHVIIGAQSKTEYLIEFLGFSREEHDRHIGI